VWYHVDPRSSKPLYQQLIIGIKEAVAKQILTPGEKLPSVRELAGQIAINPNTIAKAYQELEREGIIETMRGRGTFVVERQTPTVNLDKERLLGEMLEKLLVEAFYLQIKQEELLEIIENRVRIWYRTRRDNNR
jgi:GntR family transcriptional regulator